MEIGYVSAGGRNTACKIYGGGRAGIVIEMGLLSCMGEWHHVAQSLSQRFGGVLLYERAGINNSEGSPARRTPRAIAEELHMLLEKIPHEEKLIIIAHSQGGLYAQQFARLYPHMVRGLLLLDPLSASDNRFKAWLTPDEYKKSGVDKFRNLNFLYLMADLHLGFVIRSLMKNAPPFYYYQGFSKEARQYIFNSYVKPASTKTAMEEYRLSHDESKIERLKSRKDFPDVPLVLITHSSTVYEKELMEFGHASPELAKKIETAWQSIMRTYLSFSENARYIEAKKSGHYIHLTEPELIRQGIEWILES